MSAVLEFADVTVQRGDATLLAKVNWTVAQDASWVVLGPDGAVLAGPGADDDDPHVGCHRGVGAQPADDVDAVHARHREVEEQDVEEDEVDEGGNENETDAMGDTHGVGATILCGVLGPARS